MKTLKNETDCEVREVLPVTRLVMIYTAEVKYPPRREQEKDTVSDELRTQQLRISSVT